MPRFLFVVAVVLAILPPVIDRGLSADAPATIVPHPPLDRRNHHYPSHRDPLLPSPLVKLPVGAVRPGGWLRKQLELQAAGFHGHLTEISAFLRKDKNAWLSPDGQGERGWEEVPYWLKGFGDCAYLLGNQEQIKEAKVWIEGAIASQRADGFFGPRGKGAQATVESTKGKYDLWPNMVMLQCLRSYYEVTGDRRVLDLMTKYFRWELSVPDADFLPPYWQQQRAADNLDSVLWLYDRTGDGWLLDLATKTHRHTADWTDGVPNWHNVNMTEAFGGPAFYYPLSKDRRHLDAAERNWHTIREKYGQVPGGLFGGDENCRPGYADPRQAIETCGMVEFMYSCERLLSVAGDPRWADRCEDVAFNSLPAALTADFTALRYLTAPNLIQSDKGNKAPGFDNGGAMLEMNPYHHRCCQHNFGHGWPYLAEHLWMATGDDGLAAVVYSECEVKAKVGDGTEVTLTEHTHYPFDEHVEIKVTALKPTRFPFYLRVPGWCDNPTVRVNGEQGWSP
ncbi:MAG TPA: beta-L-arabinofuranosidase domain-containing protein, partial [Gemmataceae bacterium]